MANSFELPDKVSATAITNDKMQGIFSADDQKAYFRALNAQHPYAGAQRALPVSEPVQGEFNFNEHLPPGYPPDPMAPTYYYPQRNRN